MTEDFHLRMVRRAPALAGLALLLLLLFRVRKRLSLPSRSIRFRRFQKRLDLVHQALFHKNHNHNNNNSSNNTFLHHRRFATWPPL